MRGSATDKVRTGAALLVLAAAARAAIALQQVAMDQPAIASSHTSVSALAEACVVDLAAIGPFLLANDARLQQPASEAERSGRASALDAARSLMEKMGLGSNSDLTYYAVKNSLIA